MSDFDEMLFGAKHAPNTKNVRMPEVLESIDPSRITPASPTFKRPQVPRGMGQSSRQTCPRCFRSWSGKTICHCSGCHETFSSVNLFDVHRREDGPHGYCMKPAACRNMVFRDGMWRGPEMTEEEKANAFGGRDG